MQAAEIPILMKGWQVRALIDGRMTETRRAVKPPPTCPDHGTECPDLEFVRCEWRSGPVWTDGWNGYRRCPYGAPGDLLYVRETWACYQAVDRVRLRDGRSFSEVSDGLAAYRADGFETVEDLRDHLRSMRGAEVEAIEIKGDRWLPSIHMPKWAARIWLRREGEARVERVQDIDEASYFAEGLLMTPIERTVDGGGTEMIGPEWWKREFRTIWNDHCGPGAWERNDWVWVAPFSVVSTGGRP